MTVAMYARRKRWPLESVTVRLSHSKVHAADCAESEIVIETHLTEPGVRAR
jgi:putative redox protein